MMKRLFCFLVMLLLLAAGGGVAPGSSALAATSTYLLYEQWGGTWQDANKSAANPEDDLMCWAAAASNVLAWGGWGTPTYNTTDKIFQHIQDHWTDNVGYPRYAWNWWLTGTPPPTKTYAYVDVPGGGAFYPETTFSDYYRTVYSSYLNFAYDFFQQGYGVSLFISSGGTYGHAITAWGLDYEMVDGVRQYRSVFITDSDDGYLGLKKYDLTVKDGKSYLSGAYASWYIYGLQAFKYTSLTPDEVSPVPNPGTLLLLASGLLGLAALGQKRRV